MNWYDFGARNFDNALGRWMNIDPLAEDFYSYSPYNSMMNDPINYIDPDGRAAIWIPNNDGSYTAEAGDTVSGLEQELGLRQGDLAVVNSDIDVNKIQVGQKVNGAKRIGERLMVNDNVSDGGGDPGPTDQSEITHTLSDKGKAYAQVASGMLTAVALVAGEGMKLPKVKAPKLSGIKSTVSKSISKVDDMLLSGSSNLNTKINVAKRELVTAASKKVTSRLSFATKRKIISKGIRSKTENFMNTEHQIINSENFMKIFDIVTKSKKVRGGI